MATQNDLLNWCIGSLDDLSLSIKMVSGDASFRKYFRVYSSEKPNHTWIAVDAPPDKENNPAFVKVAQAFDRQGIHVPQIINVDYDEGFMLLSDFGDQLLSEVLLDQNCAQKWYALAFEPLLRLQDLTPRNEFPPYSAQLLQAEMSLFKDWLIAEHLGISLTSDEQADLASAFDFLERMALAQPQIWVHRDYHSRNLMVCREQQTQLGIIDFQDAVIGPATYDLVSLIKDCYVNWPTNVVETWAFTFKEKSNLLRPVKQATFLKWFRTMGVQRHLKASGIFCRLCYRDGKKAYLNDIPRTLAYVSDTAPKIPELHSLAHLLENKIIPKMAPKHRKEIAVQLARLGGA